VAAIKFKLVGKGTYTVADANRLTGVPAMSIRRWTQGYRYRYVGKWRTSPPVIEPEISLDGIPVLTFSDLIELRVLHVLRVKGVSHPAIRAASERAKELLLTSHPFSHSRFKTDGRAIILNAMSGFEDAALLDLVRDQFEFSQVVAPLLSDVLDYDDTETPRRWWPLTHDRQVVIDPLRRFGQPIVAKEGLPTRTLAKAVTVEGDSGAVAWWYEVSQEAVRDAVEYEATLRRRAA
jgi:uncharacterized protein (DUF433 family)